jgi:Flp pilus assembly pilin Flp
MKRTGQSTLEFAVIIAMVAGALLAMQYYMKRGVEGKLRESTDQMGEQYSAGGTLSTYITDAEKMETRETFGLPKDATSIGDHTTGSQGISYYKIVTAGTTKREATGGNAEKINTALSAEELIPQ